MKKFLIFLIILLSLFSIKINAQNDLFCSDDLQTLPTQNFPRFPNIGTIKALVIYGKFTDDDFDSSPYTNNWPSSLNNLPGWTSQTIYPNVMSNYPDPSISGYFKEMSRGQFNLIGKVCSHLFTALSTEYRIANGKNISYLSEDMLNFADQYENFSEYIIMTQMILMEMEIKMNPMELWI